MSWPMWSVAPDRAALLTEAQLIGAAITTIVGLPVLAFACMAAVDALFHVSLALGGPFPLISQTFVLLVFSIVGSWLYFIVAVPLVSFGLRTGRIGFVPTAMAGAGIGFSVTFIIALFLPIGVGDMLGLSLITGCFGVGFSLVFWMLVRLINRRAFDDNTEPSDTGRFVQ